MRIPPSVDLSQQSLAPVRPFRNDSRAGLAQRLFTVSAFLFFCFLYGVTFSLFAPALLMPLVGILILPAALVLWALPTTIRPPTHSLEYLVLSFTGVTVLWPVYLAINLPGLPWITLSRLVQVPFAFTLLLCCFVSVSFRKHLLSVMAETRWLAILICAFVVLQIISVMFSSDPGNSINRLILALIGWAAIYVASCYIFSSEGTSERFATALCIYAMILGGIGFLEHRVGQVPWANHVPHFLQINDPSVKLTLSNPGLRYGGAHRVQTTYTTSLGFAEYLALVFPFAIYFATTARRFYIRVASRLLVPLLVVMVSFSQSRIGFVGLFLTCVVYPMAWGFVRWWNDRKNIFSAAIVFLSPVIFIAAVASVFLVHGLRRRVLGGAGEESSTQARFDQVRMGIPKILHQPWGHGIGQGAAVLGYHNPGGLLTIDSYWLRLALEYGVAGLVLYIAIFGAGLFYAARGALISADRQTERKLFIPIACALLSSIIMKAAYAQEDNQIIVFLLFGMLTGQFFQSTSSKKLNEDST